MKLTLGLVVVVLNVQTGFCGKLLKFTLHIYKVGGQDGISAVMPPFQHNFSMKFELQRE